MSTSLNLIFVLPASSPSPVLKLMVMVGPCCRIACAASQTPISTATTGTSQIHWTRQRERVTGTASGSPGGGESGGRDMCGLPCIPGQPRVERHRGEHRQYDDRAECDGRGARGNRRERVELHERGQNRDHVDVEHR